MSLDIAFTVYQLVPLVELNITHNLAPMAKALGIYTYLWHPEKKNLVFAHELTNIIDDAIIEMKSNPDKYKTYDSANGWGVYDDFLNFLEKLRIASIQFPDSRIQISI